jgi:hypothetical protein
MQELVKVNLCALCVERVWHGVILRAGIGGVILRAGIGGVILHAGLLVHLCVSDWLSSAAKLVA